jgi:hypothetical protein
VPRRGRLALLLLTTPWIALALLAPTCDGGGTTPVDRVARAVRITSEAELLSGRTARGRVGDFKLWNDKVTFVLSDVGLDDGYQRYGGLPVDADVVRAAGEPGASQLGSIFFGFDQRLFEPEAAEVVADGDGGETGDRAVVRFTGQDGYFPWLASFMGTVFPVETIDCDLTYEYSLGPGDEALRVDITVRNRARTEQLVDMVEVAFIAGDGLKPFFMGPGFDEGEHQGEFSYWLGMGDRLSYAVLAEDGPLEMLLNISNVAFGTLPSFSVPRRGEYHLTRHLAVAEGGLDQVQRVLRELGLLAPEPTGVLEGEIRCAGFDLTDIPVRIHVLDEAGAHRSVIRPVPGATDALVYTSELPVGRYSLLAKADGLTPSPTVEVEVTAAGPARADLDLTAPAPITYRLEDGAGAPAPGRLTFVWQAGEPPTVLAAGYGEERYPNSSALTVWSGTGEGEARLPPGAYEVIATRGSEREQARQTLELGAAGADLTFELGSPVDSTGWLAGDFHIHAQYSPDSDVAPEFRVRTGLSEGLELLVMTEHDTIRDFTPAVESIPGAGAHIRAIIGSEITTYLYGHFQAWPLTEKPDQLNRGGIDWFDTPAPELFARIRASEATPVIIQANHPRGVSAGSYFTALGLVRESGTIENWDLWSEDFDAIEVFNGGCSNGDSEPKLDFYDMLNRGYRVSVSAGTDSHSQFSTLGAPRVYVPSAHAPADFEPQELVTAFQGQRVYVSCGPVVAFQVEGRGLGELAPATGGQVTAHVRVEAPTWMAFLEARLVKNGELAWSLPAADWTGAGGGVRLERDVPVAVDADAWLALEVTGQGSLWPIDGDTPYALTNPIYVDADGDGVWTPPKPPYQPKSP